MDVFPLGGVGVSVVPVKVLVVAMLATADRRHHRRRQEDCLGATILGHAQASKVEITLEEDGGELVPEIDDDGRGITEEEKSSQHLAVVLLHVCPLRPK